MITAVSLVIINRSSAFQNRPPECNTIVPQGLQVQNVNPRLSDGSTNLSKLAFVIPSGSSMDLCVRYSLGTTSSRASVGSSVAIYSVKSIAVSTSGYSGFSYSYAPASGFTVSSNESSIKLASLNAPINVTVAYSITASPRARKGFSISRTRMSAPLLSHSPSAMDPLQCNLRIFPVSSNRLAAPQLLFCRAGLL